MFLIRRKAMQTRTGLIWINMKGDGYGYFYIVPRGCTE
jgi:hypothetical protein